MKNAYKKGSVTLLCNLQNFFPAVIKVVWKISGRNEELEYENTEIMHNASNNMYSLYSWITVGNSDIGKIYKCMYKHESTGNTWNEKVYKTGGADVNPMVIRAAQLIYTLLFIKGLLYCPILLCVKLKTNN
ncbi:T-cell receptor gamma alternate reading frame protein [Dendrobates tinctorius]|uniref:T-cell receptor gamma alternate reading frame protein n=1 Tax=Dendrobates tinctorius TaxID=92724 RepID=UPI003CC9CF3C